MRKITLLGFVFLMALLTPFSALAQVTIGSNKAPESFSVLELINGQNSDEKRGLRLPQLTPTQHSELANQLSGLYLSAGWRHIRPLQKGRRT